MKARQCKLGKNTSQKWKKWEYHARVPRSESKITLKKDGEISEEFFARRVKKEKEKKSRILRKWSVMKSTIKSRWIRRYYKWNKTSVKATKFHTSRNSRMTKLYNSITVVDSRSTHVLPFFFLPRYLTEEIFCPLWENGHFSAVNIMLIACQKVEKI